MVGVGSHEKTWRFTTGREMIKVFCRVDLLLTLLSIFSSPCANTELIPEKNAPAENSTERDRRKVFVEKFVSKQKNPPCQILSVLL